LNILHQAIQKGHQYLIIASAVQCNSKEEMIAKASEIEANGDEGVILKKPQSYYHDFTTLVNYKVILLIQDVTNLSRLTLSKQL
jgi:hypothetical protein